MKYFLNIFISLCALLHCNKEWYKNNIEKVVLELESSYQIIQAWNKYKYKYFWFFTFFSKINSQSAFNHYCVVYWCTKWRKNWSNERINNLWNFYGRYTSFSWYLHNLTLDCNVCHVIKVTIVIMLLQHHWQR